MPFEIIRNDISRVKADAIVDTASPEPVVGPGVDLAIYTAAGYDELLAEREKIGSIAPGQAVATPAFALDAKYIIHTVGPAWRGGEAGELETVAACYRNSLRLAEKLGCGSIAFPLISTGTLGFPKDLALRAAINEISAFLLQSDMMVSLVVFDSSSFVLSGKLISGVREYISEKEAEARLRADAEAGLRADPFGNAGSAARSCAERGRRSFHRASRDAAAPAGAKRRPSIFGGLPGLGRFGGAKKTVNEEESYEYISASRIPDFEDLKDPEETGGSDETEELRESPQEAGYEESGSYPFGEPADRSESASIDDRLKLRSETFQEHLFRVIDRKGLKDPEVYKAANLDRKLFSKIRSDVYYTPSKRTALALALALRLNGDEARDLLLRAGLALSPSDPTDIIIQYCIDEGIYNLYEINCILFEYGQPMLGSA